RILLAALMIVMCSSSVQGIVIRKALVIGNDNYPGNRLKNAVNDATAVADSLTSMGYSTTLVTDASHNMMGAAIEAFAQRLTTGDTAILYYTGHGLQVNGENYLVPIDFRVTTPADVKHQGYSLSSIINTFTTHGAGTQIIILDACRNNPFLGSRSMQEGWACVSTSAGTLLAFGTSPGSTASDYPTASHGLFTRELLKYLATSSLNAEQMFQQVREDVIRASNGTQVPWTASSLIGSFHFKPELDTSYAALPSVSSVPDAGNIDAGRSLVDTMNNESNHFTASSVSKKQRLFSPPAISGEDQQIYYPLISRAAMLAQNGNYDESVRTLKAVLELDPQSAVALRILGLVFNLMGQHAKSITTLNRAVSIDPQDAKSYYYRCLVQRSGDATAAVEDCEASLGIDPGNSEVYLGLANAFLALGQINRARTEVDQAIKLDPHSSLGYSILGKISTGQGDVEDANRDYQRAITLASGQ